MHSFDRTYLSRLGFSDPDKRDRRHDLACQYLAQPANRDRLIGSLRNPGMTAHTGSSFDERGERIEFNIRPVFEQPISKGEGQYKTTVGFVDLMLPFAFSIEYGDGSTRYGRSFLCIEVKIQPVGLGDLLRQIGLYREFEKVRCPWMVASTFRMSAPDVETLRSANIYHAHLGEAFEEWMERRAEEDSLHVANSFSL